MYGLNAYSRAPYASFSTVYADTVTEATITETDAESVVATFITVITEAISALNDAPSYTYLVSSTENLTAADVNSAVASFVSAISESVSPVDLANVVAAFASAITEANTVADSPVFTWNLNISETATVADSPTGFGIFAYAVIENMSSMTDGISVASSFPVSVIEAISSFLETEAGPATFASSVSEGNTVASVQIGGYSFVITENISPADNKTVVAAFVSTANENVNTADTPTALASFVSSKIETITLNSTPIATGWVKINDSQIPNWTIISTGN